MLALLALLWLGLGVIIGLIANTANLQPPSWRTFGLIRMAAVGALTAFCGGWSGILLLGRPFATVMALWIAVVGVVCIPWLLSRFEAGSMNHQHLKNDEYRVLRAHHFSNVQDDS